MNIPVLSHQYYHDKSHKKSIFLMLKCPLLPHIKHYKGLIHTLFNHILHDDVPVTGSPPDPIDTSPRMQSSTLRIGAAWVAEGSMGPSMPEAGRDLLVMDRTAQLSFLDVLGSLRCHQTWEHPPV